MNFALGSRRIGLNDRNEGAHVIMSSPRMPVVLPLLFNRLSLILTASVGASVAWTIVAGQDLNFDLITYHYYLGYSAFVPRFHLDFLTAWVYGYQSPLPYMSLYWLDSIGTPPVVNASLHAAFHALNLTFLYLLAELLAGKAGTTPERVKVIALWSLGAIAPIYWTLVGTSFADPLTSVPVLAGLWLVARAIPESGRLTATGAGWIALGAVLIGVAVGARIHNGIYVAGLLCALVLARFPDQQSRVRAIAAFSLAAFSGWLLSFAPWAYRVYEEFGNPVFPLFNGVFRSPDFPPSNLALITFTPDNLWDLVTLPFWMATDTAWVYVELPLPDVRPALLTICLLACTFLWLFHRSRRLRSATGPEVQTAEGEAGTAQARRLILIFFAVSAVLWLATSSNGRFGVALFLLGGPVCGVLLSRLLPTRYVLLVIAAVVLWQAVLQEVFFRQYRFNSMPWTARYFDWNLPDRLAREPATFVSFGFQPASTLAPRLHPESSHINLVGYPAIDAPGSDRVRRIIHFPNRRSYGIFDVTRQNPVNPAAIKIYYRNQLALWELAFTDDACALITLKTPSGSWTWLNGVARVKARYRPPAFLICALQPSESLDHERALSEFRDFADKLGRFGAACPQYFGKPLGYVHTDQRWIVTSFASSEIRMEFDHEGPFRLQQLTPPHVALELGRVTHDAIVAEEPDCRIWFSRLSELSARVSRTDGVAPSKQ